ncbi:ATP-binding protein [Candidatus Gracilibacteria bacterium]|nr:ATP-binding protein [Candidatus Gracilibacteria bacterium]
MVQLNISSLEYETALAKLKELVIDPNNIQIHIDFGADHTQSKIIRDFVGSIFDFHGIVAPWRGRFILITDELVNNAIEHGSTCGDIDSCIIQAKKDAHGFFSINLEVHDTGNGKDAALGKDMIAVKISHIEKEKDGVYMEKRGRGLFSITEKLVDKLSFSESPKGGLAVRIEKNITQDQYTPEKKKESIQA